MVAQLGYSVVERSGGRVTSCAVYTVHMEMRSVCFLVESQNQDLRFLSGFEAKPLRQFVSGLISKSPGRFVSGLASKPLGWFSRFGQKTSGGGFPSLGLKTDFYGLVIWALKSP
jgi:hypothetical protein